MKDFTTLRWTEHVTYPAMAERGVQLRTFGLPRSTPAPAEAAVPGYKALARTLLQLELAMTPEPEPSDTPLTAEELRDALLMHQRDFAAAGIRVVMPAAPTPTEADRKRMAKAWRTIRRTGVKEIAWRLKHPAFRMRVAPCAQHPTQIACPCDTPLLRQLRGGFARSVAARDWYKLAVILFECRQVIRHFYDFLGQSDEPAHANGDRRVLREADLIATRVVRWSLGRDTKGRFAYEDTHTVELVERRGRASVLDVDLQGWDRPTSMPTKTTRLAFCGACASRAHNPWWRVPRRRTKTGYEQAPFALRHSCPRCATLETTPRPAGPAPRLVIKQRLREHLKITTFERNRGRWYTLTTQHGTLRDDHVTWGPVTYVGEATWVLLNHKLEQRWRQERQDRQR